MNIKVKTNFDKRKFESAVKEKTVEALNKRTYEIECPHCHDKISVQPGKSFCPRCHKTVDLNLNIKF